MDSKERNESSDIGPIFERRLNSWKEFVDFIWPSEEAAANMTARGLPNGGNWVWRGHRSSRWKLISSFDRQVKNVDKRSDVLGAHRRHFAYAARGKLQEFGLSIRELKRLIRGKILNPNHLWALAQHYGLSTPLLDWSTSPFVAAYFAFEEPSRLEDLDWSKPGGDADEIKMKLKDDSFEDDEYLDRAIIGLNYEEVSENKNEASENTNTGLKYFSPLSSEHPRLINQRDLFTIAQNGEDVQTIVEKNFRGEAPWLIKLLIPNGARMDFLRGLNLMNINRATLFPELGGAAHFCNLGLEIHDYATFPGADQARASKRRG